MVFLRHRTGRLSCRSCSTLRCGGINLCDGLEHVERKTCEAIYVCPMTNDPLIFTTNFDRLVNERKNMNLLRTFSILLVVLSTSLFGQGFTASYNYNYRSNHGSWLDTTINDPNLTGRYILETFYLDQNGVQRQHEDICYGGLPNRVCTVPLPDSRDGQSFLYQMIYETSFFPYNQLGDFDRYIVETEYMNPVTGTIELLETICRTTNCPVPTLFPTEPEIFYQAYWGSGPGYRIGPPIGYPVGPTSPLPPPYNGYGISGYWVIEVTAKSGPNPGWLASATGFLIQSGNNFSGDMTLSGFGSCGQYGVVNGTVSGTMLFNLNEGAFYGTMSGTNYASGTWNSTYGCMAGYAGTFRAFRP